jgi:uncharacterized protein YndB with AHSA1/START domain
MITTLPYQLDRVLTIGARPETVFSFFTDSERWSAWWGAGSTIEPRVGGRVLVVHPGGVQAAGEVLELQPPERIVFTYGYVSGSPIAAGASKVTIRLAPHADGTQLHLTHEFDDAGARDEHVQGWRFQLSPFANAVANVVNADAAGVVDQWFSAWNEADQSRRRELIAHLATTDVRFCDKFSRTDGQPELDAHLDAARRFMPGLELKRNGAVRHCQGVAVADLVASKEGKALSSGTNVFVLDADGRIRQITGLWG